MNRKIIPVILVALSSLLFENVKAQDVYAGKKTKVADNNVLRT